MDDDDDDARSADDDDAQRHVRPFGAATGGGANVRIIIGCASASAPERCACLLARRFARREENSPLRWSHDVWPKMCVTSRAHASGRSGEKAWSPDMTAK